MLDVADQVVGRVDKRGRKIRFTDEELLRLSEAHSDLRMELISNQRICAT
jgi:hypothetical protein